MKCSYVMDNIADLFDEGTDQQRKDEILAHAGSCPSCAEDYAEYLKVLEELTPAREIRAGQDFRNRIFSIMENEVKNDSTKRRNQIMMNQSWKKIAAVMAVLVIAIAVITLVSRKGGAGNSVQAANSLIEKSLQAMAGVVSVYVDFDVRTAPGDNFEYINPATDFVNHKIWRVNGDPPMWRIEKEGRVVVMDGKKKYMYIKNTQMAVFGGRDAGFVDWMGIFLNPTKILNKEKEDAKKNHAEYEITESGNTTTLTVKAKALGDFSNTYLFNTSVPQSDNRRVYTFDKQTRRLQSFEVFVMDGKNEVQVIKSREIKYNIDIPANTFAISIPDNVKWIDAKDLTGGQDKGIEASSAEEVAKKFFEACGNGDWAMVDKLMPGVMQSGNAAQIKEMLGGLKIKSLGKSFKSGQYPGEFVPYEIVFKTGDTKKMNLAIRNDNPAKKWTVDGGL
jgi:outer membrane lipoprotein-sorting protein